MPAEILDGKYISSSIIEDLRLKVNELTSECWKPKLVSIKIGNSPAVDLYIRNQRLKSIDLGIDFCEKEYASHVTFDEIKASIYAMNVDPSITGIILQRPIDSYLSIRDIQTLIHPLKDVEGMHPTSIGNIVYNDIECGPCTAMAAVEILRRTDMVLEGLEVTVIGHSEIVGKPIAFLLMAEGATVTVCHHMTKDVYGHSVKADAVFIATGKPNMLKSDMIKSGAAVIDIGINRILKPDGNYIITGDCSFDECKNTAGWITPVPGGVGPVTVAMLMRNTVTATMRLKAYHESLYSNNLNVVNN